MKNLLGADSEQLPNIFCSEGGVMLKVIGYFWRDMSKCKSYVQNN